MWFNGTIILRGNIIRGKCQVLDLVISKLRFQPPLVGINLLNRLGIFGPKFLGGPNGLSGKVNHLGFWEFWTQVPFPGIRVTPEEGSY